MLSRAAAISLALDVVHQIEVVDFVLDLLLQFFVDVIPEWRVVFERREKRLHTEFAALHPRPGAARAAIDDHSIDESTGDFICALEAGNGMQR